VPFPLGAHRFAGADRFLEKPPRVRSAGVPGCQTGSRGGKYWCHVSQCSHTVSIRRFRHPPTGGPHHRKGESRSKRCTGSEVDARHPDICVNRPVWWAGCDGLPQPGTADGCAGHSPRLTATGSGGITVAAVSAAGLPSRRWCSQISRAVNPGPVQSVWRWVGSRRLRTARTRSRL
jgi:hypothetical protein